MTTDTITQDRPVAVIETPKKIWITAFVFAFLALLCDGADLGFLALSLTSLKAEFHLTGVQAGTLGSLTLLGSAIGGLFGGWACDRFGRVRIIVFFVAYSSILTCALGFTQSYMQFACIRVLGAMGLGALYIACNVLMSEMVPTKHRTTVLATLMTGYTLGSLLSMKVLLALVVVVLSLSLQSCKKPVLSRISKTVTLYQTKVFRRRSSLYLKNKLR